MLRIKEFNKRAMDTLTDDIERRIARTENMETDFVSGYKMTIDEDTGKLVLTKNDVTITFTKD